jgi:hypothetical protein
MLSCDALLHGPMPNKTTNKILIKNRCTHASPSICVCVCLCVCVCVCVYDTSAPKDSLALYAMTRRRGLGGEGAYLLY